MADEKTGYKILEYIAVFVILMCVLFKGFGTEDRQPSRLQNDVNSTMADVKQQYEFVGSESNIVTDRIVDAEQSIKRAEELGYRINGRVKRHQDSIAKCTSIVIECRDILDENRKILSGVKDQN